MCVYNVSHKSGNNIVYYINCWALLRQSPPLSYASVSHYAYNLRLRRPPFEGLPRRWTYPA